MYKKYCKIIFININHYKPLKYNNINHNYLISSKIKPKILLINTSI